MPSQKEIREQITSRIVTAIESGVMPWRRPWRMSKNSGRPANVVSKRAYSGVNPILLYIAAIRHGLQSKWWATYQQWAALGCQVKKRPDGIESGQWGTGIVFFKPIRKTVVNDETGEEQEERFGVLRTYTVFNADQVSGAERFQVIEEPGVGNTEPDYRPAAELIAATGADIRHGGERAFYSPDGDYIQLPNRERFGSLGCYYCTALHELSHWSEPRQHYDREQLGYAMCELVAEIASCFTASEIGIPHGEGLENHAAYVKSWLDQMKGDASFIFKASRMASATTDFLLAFVRQPEPEAVAVA
jgi:antirestriction protein ArdC